MKTKKDNNSIFWPVIKSALIFAPFGLPLLWIVEVMHFGFVSGPDPRSLVLWISYIVLSSSPAALIFAKTLQKQIEKTNKKLKYWDAFKIALISLSFIQASVAIITLYQFGDDTLTFLLGLILSLGSATILTDILSKKGK